MQPRRTRFLRDPVSYDDNRGLRPMHAWRRCESHDTSKAARARVCGRQRLPLHKESICQAQPVQQHAGERQGTHARHGLHIHHAAWPGQQHARQHRGDDQGQARPRAIAQEQLRLRGKHDAHGGAERHKRRPNRAGVGLPHLRRSACERAAALWEATRRAPLCCAARCARCMRLPAQRRASSGWRCAQRVSPRRSAPWRRCHWSARRGWRQRTLERACARGAAGGAAPVSGCHHVAARRVVR